jgi:TetR/AcrR family transcriptional regulator, cholesterol catabolism regulator
MTRIKNENQQKNESRRKNGGKGSVRAPRAARLERKLEILNHAIQLIDEHGFAQISLADIADSVGIKREGLYYYYKNRAEILMDIVRPTAEDLVSNLKSILKRNIPSRRKLELAIENHLLRFERAHLETRITLKDNYFQEDEALMLRMKPIWENYGSLWVKLVREGQATGAFRKDVDPRIAAFGIIGMCNWVSRWYNPKERIGVRKLIDSFMIIAFDGIGPDVSAWQGRKNGRRRAI